MKTIEKIILFIFLFLLILATVFDLQISELLVDQSSIFGRIIEEYGEVPGYIIIVLAITININAFLEVRITKNFVLAGFMLIISIILNYVILSKIFSQGVFVVSSLSLLFSVGIVIIFRQYNIGYDDSSIKFSRIVLLMAIISPLLIVQTTKIVWGRLRYRNLRSDHSNFTPWFLPQGITGNKSFPSGHAAMAWMLLPLTSLFSFSNKQVERALWVSIILWGLLVSIGRIIIGAHYLSDVIFSSIISLLSFDWVNKNATKKESSETRDKMLS